MKLVEVISMHSHTANTRIKRRNGSPWVILIVSGVNYFTSFSVLFHFISMKLDYFLFELIHEAI